MENPNEVQQCDVGPDLFKSISRSAENLDRQFVSQGTTRVKTNGNPTQLATNDNLLQAVDLGAYVPYWILL